MTRDPSRVLAYGLQIQYTARLLWENGEMLSDAEGRNPTWDEVCSSNDFFYKRMEVEGYAKAAVASGLYSATAQLADAMKIMAVARNSFQDGTNSAIAIDDFLYRIDSSGGAG